MVLVVRTLKESRDSLLAVGYLAVGYILVSSLIIFNVEPQTFPTFFDALYWATVSLTTVGYGDIYPVSTIGRCVTMFSSLLGIALIALPAGIVTAGYLNALQSLQNQNKEK
jgi:voltage-gated potassium channel